MFLSIIVLFSFLWSAYLIIDDMNHNYIPHRIPENQDYTKKFLFSFDGDTSFIEEIVFGMVCQTISFSLMLDFVWSVKKHGFERKDSDRKIEKIRRNKKIT